MENLRYLSVRQPFALAIVSGVKPIENRAANSRHRGLLVIHAGRNKSDLKSYWQDDPELKKYLDAFALGAAIGVVDMTDAGELSPKFESFPFAFGPKCYRFENPRVFAKPIPFSGFVGIKAVPENVEAEIRAQIETAIIRNDLPGPWLKAMQTEEYQLCYNQGVTYYDMEKYEWALARFDAASKLKPDFVWAIHDRAITHWTLGDYNTAFADLHRAIEIAPEIATLYSSRAKMLATMGDDGQHEKYHEAIIEMSRAIELDNSENAAQYYFYRARMFGSIGEEGKAEDDYRKAKELNPKLYEELLKRVKHEESQG